MERFQLARDKALLHFKAANHMLSVTYPLIKDPKILLGVMDSMFLAITNTMAAILWYDRLFKNIPPFHDNFESKFNMFQAKSAQMYKIPKETIKLIQDIKDIMILHRKSPLEFRRKDKFIISNESYQLKALTAPEIKEYLKKTKSFIAAMTDIISKHERIFG